MHLQKNMKIPGMKCALKEHQIHALRWQLEAEKNHSGGLNGHLPGLGKTIQALSLVCMDRVVHTASNWDGHGTLIIVPACVTVQWFEQLQDKTDLRGFLYYDKWRRELNDFVKTDEQTTDLFSFLNRFDVVITSYSTIMIDSFFRRQDLKWFRVIIDEAHVLRNVSSKRFSSLLNLKGKFKWGLSGTLLMNTPMDLFGPMQFIGLWKKHEKAKFANALQRGNIAKHVLESSEEDIANLALPPLSVETIHVDLEKGWEEEAYKDLLNVSRSRISMTLATNVKGIKKSSAHIFALLMKLRQAANAVPLVDKMHQDKISAKCSTVLQIVKDRLQSDATTKFILFSNFTQILALYKQLFAEIEVKSLIYSGDLNARQREDILNRYKEGDEASGEEFSVLLASTPCANAGINIT